MPVNKQKRNIEKSYNSCSDLTLKLWVGVWSFNDLLMSLMTDDFVERDLDTPLAEALREMGYTNQVIQTAMDQWRRRLRPGEIDLS